MQKILSDFSKVLSGRAFVVKSTTPAAPVELTLVPQNEILQEIQILLQPTTILLKDFGFKIFVGERQIFPALGSQDVGTTWSGNATGWGAMMSGNALTIGPLNLIMDGPPYNVKFQFYNADAANDGYVFVWLRVTPKIDLPAAPIQDDARVAKNSAPVDVLDGTRQGVAVKIK